MNLLDGILIAIVAVSVITAAMKGFVYEVWMMAATLAALALAVWQYPALAPHLAWLGGGETQNFAAFVLVLLAVLIVAAIVGRMLRGLLHGVGLGGPDRLLGAGLGLARGLLLGVAVVFMLTAYPVNARLIAGSELAPDFVWASRALTRVMPSALAARFEQGLRRGVSLITNY